MQAVILAGGKGTRLAERLNGRPKPLVDVDGVPLLQRQIEFLRARGVDDFVVLVNHAADQIERFLEQNDHFGCKVTTLDDGEPRGSAGAVLQRLEQLQSRFLVVYGDTLFSIDIDRMVAAHEASGADATLFLHPNDHPHDSDLVELDDDDRILAFHPYPHPPGALLANQVNAAFYVLERQALAPWRDLPGLIDFGKDLFPRMLDAGVSLNGYRSFEYIKDLGTPKRLDKVERHLREGVVERANLSAGQACVFVDRDGTLNVQRDYVRTPDQLELIDGAAGAVRRLNDLEYRVAVVTNQPVIARGELDADGLRRIHAKLETELGAAGAYVDRIYYCPHHPDSGFAGERRDLKIACDCRKPMPGLLAMAARDLNADLPRAWMIGDSTADLLAAERFGVRSILVGTGEGGRDGKHLATPDFAAPDFPAAVTFLAETYPRLAARAAPLVAEARAGDLILIGGLARTGKSSFASALAHELRGAGLSAASLSFDRWILPQDQRGEGVEQRFDLAGAARTLEPWLAGGALDAAAPFYDRHRRRMIADGPRLSVPADGVLVLEGVPALLASLPTRRRVVRVFVQADEAARADRVKADLRARDATLGGAGADAVYEGRCRDESPLVLASADRADLRLTLDADFAASGGKP